jgi:hypothetical protein
MDFTVNDDLATYTVEEIAALITAGNEALDALFAIETPTREQTTEAARILAAVQSLEAEATGRTEAASEMTALREARETARVEAAAAAETAEAEAEAETDEADADDEDEDAEVEAEEKVAVTAGAPAPKPRKRGGARPDVEPPAPATRMTLTAAADVPGFSTGQSLESLSDVSTALLNRMRSFPQQPQGIPGASLSRYGVSMFRKEFPENLIATGNNDQEVMDRASSEARLPNGNLLAAGGWCAPSQTLYDFCEGETSEGLIDLPEMQITRGGVRTTPGPDFSTLYTSSGFTQTEAQAIAGTTKPCYEVVCPAFTDTRLDVVGLCIKVPILTNAAYPELVRRTISLALIAHQHRLSASLITKMVAKATAVTTASVGSATANTLNAVALVAETLRGEYRLSLNATLEVVLPSWVREAIRADMGIRMGADAAQVALADAAITSFFTARKVRVQWVYNWQMLVNGEEGFPATFQMMVYPAGTFVKGTADVISLDAVYDAASLSVNTYTGLFVEEGVLLLQNCFKAKIVTVNACAGGVTGAASNAACFTLT